MTLYEGDEFLESDLLDLKQAKKNIESPGLIASLSSLIGSPIEQGIDKLPESWKKNLSKVTEGILMKALDFAIYTLGDSDTKKSQEWFHKLLVATSGGVGGAFGLASIPVEMPISTAIFLRGIADVARSEGHDISLLSVRLECLSVLALGGDSKKDDAAETGYWGVRMTLNKAVPQAIEKIITEGAGKNIATNFSRFISIIASRFAIIVSEEAVARTIPLVIGAVAAGTINLLFMNHFQDMARGHFIIKRLEKKYGIDSVKAKYNEIDV
jgi:hypothetical protein